MKFILALCAVALLAVAQSQFGVRSLRGPAVWIRDSPAGNDVLVNLDAATLAIDPPGTAGGRPTLRAIVPTSPAVAIREKAVQWAYTGAPFTLPDTPLVNTVVKVYWGALPQIPGVDYTVSGRVVTLVGTGWQAGDPLMAIYFH